MSSGLERCSIGSLLSERFSGAWGSDPSQGSSNATVLRSTDIDDDGHVDLSRGARRHLSPRDLSLRRLRAGDILLEASGGGPGKPVGRPAWFADETPVEQYATSNFFKVLRPNTDLVDPKYLLYALVLMVKRPEIWRFQQQTTGITNLNFSEYLKHEVVVPPLAEQRRIAETLDMLDERISSLQRVVQKLERSREGLIRDSLKKKDFDQFLPLGSLADIGAGVTLGSEPSGPGTVARPYLRVANVQDGRLDLREMKFVRVRLSDLSRFELQPGDVLMNEGGDADKLGRGAVWEGQIPGCLHQNHVFRVRCHLGELNPHYLSLVTGSAIGKRYFLAASKQTTNLATINSQQIKHFPVPFRSIPLQLQIVEAAAAFAERIEVERSELAKARLLKSGLMADLLTGRVRAPAEVAS